MKTPILSLPVPLSALVLCTLLFVSGSAQAEPGALSSTQGDQILAELKEIHRLLLAQQAPAAKAPAAVAAAPLQQTIVSVPVSNHDSLGSVDAPVVLVEYTDYQCPFCRRFHERTWPELRQRYIDTGKVRFEVRDMPLPFHEEALPAALVARCAGRQGKFWPVFEALLGKPEALTKEGPRQAAINAGASGPLLDQCTRDPAIRQAIDADAADAERIGVDGTPGFIVARRHGDKLEGTLILGAQPASTFATRIDALLAAPQL
jgi:protein-disulfide isomerase